MGTHFDGPVVGLIGKRCLSSAEWFTLMLRAAGATLIGDTTRGGSGNPQRFTLDNDVSYTVSQWVAYTGDMVAFEDVGIAPDTPIPADSSFDETRDYVLEAGLDELSK
jgi:C-terminal processing protease CtpA/Prc